ncbi:MAG TPA: hypothetical protein VF795_06520, partial [Desulfuromonadaceae bacterium]
AFSWRASNGFHQWFTFARAGGGSGGGGGAALAGNDGKSAYSAPAGVLMGGSIQGNALTLQGTFTHFATLPSTYKGFLEGAAGITTDGTNLYVVAGPHGIWGAPGVVYKVSISTGAVTELASIPAPGNITTDGTNVYVQVGGGSIDEISISTGAVSALSTDSHYSSGPMTTNGKYLYVRNGSLPSDKIDMLSTSNGRVSGSSYNTSAMMPDYITTDGQKLLILGHNFSNRIALFKMRFGTHMVAQSDLIIDNISEGPMTCDGKNLFIVSGSGITKVSISTGAASTLSWSGHYATDSFPGITTDGKSLFVVDHTANTILRIQ